MMNDVDYKSRYSIIYHLPTKVSISDEAGKVSLKLWISINCYFGNRSGNVDFSAPHSNGGAYLDLCGYYTLNVTAGDKGGRLHSHQDCSL